ncbi:MAG TPA: TetR/AcrR family transcriptional regulator [Streptosporangiaceae bacterium]|nr:TetR/AcrR family transcriptional regulator [Streptosporangiaceae bacterium]
MVQAPSRRDRARAATTGEIKQTARRILVAGGPDAVSLRAIAREMGMTAPALYRYFASHEDLIEHVVADIFAEIADGIHAAVARAGQASGGDLTQKLIAACREFRHWSLAHQAEFGLLFGTPLPTLQAVHDNVIAICEQNAQKFSGEFFSLFLELWRRHPFPVAADDEMDPSLRAQLARYRDGLGSDLPLGAFLTFLRCWVRLYGMVSLEVFGHLHFALDDAAPMFEITLAELAGMVGLAYLPGAPPAGQPGFAS